MSHERTSRLARLTRDNRPLGTLVEHIIDSLGADRSTYLESPFHSIDRLLPRCQVDTKMELGHSPTIGQLQVCLAFG